MHAIPQTAFDKIAPQYDALWSDTPIGQTQRSAVWDRIDLLYKKGDFVLDLGCGTGVDALHLQSRGVSVYGIDSSNRMVEIARTRGVDAHCCPIEHLEYFDLRLDGAMSNFGALNCLGSLDTICASLARMVRRAGFIALCFLNRVCIWEMAFYLSRTNPAKAFRRLKSSAASSIGVSVFYPSKASIVSAFQKSFRLLNSYGIGLSVPPSYVKCLTGWELQQLSAFDRHAAHRPVFRALADHRLYIFERI
ncbi:MAG TPA: class I SAM-dependent methyltransferase [Bryobacteraceae bacterium]|nr:class I SAM-dependent methyltransferase [Bryobacteraceae bacterium]